MNLVFFLFRNSGGVVLCAVLAGVVSGFTNVALLLLIHRALSPRHTGARGAEAAWLFVGLCLAAVAAKILSQTLLIGLSRKSIARLSMHLSERILAAPLRQLEEMGPARLLAILTGDIPMIAQGLQTIPTLCVNVVIVLTCLAYLAWLSWVVFVSLLVLLLLGLVVQRLLGAKALRDLKAARETGDTLHVHYRGLIEGIKELKIHGARREAFLNGPLKTTTDTLEKQNTTGQFLLAVATSGGRFLFFALIGFLLFVPPSLLPVDRPTLSGYVIALLFMMAPIQSFGPAIQVLARAKVALQKVEDLGKFLVVPIVNGRSDKQPEIGPTWSKLELVGITHSYRRERDGTGFTLGPIDLSFQPGELVFLVGGNGSGKTTLAKLLVGLYRPETGEIHLDGKPIRPSDREAYRQFFSVLFSDFHLFESLLGLEHPTLDQQALTYLTELHLDHKVTVQEGHLSTTDLSRGQRKRLALLTAYLEDRPIYVFDEWASDQDPLFKQVFYTQILPQLKARGKLVLAITHDDRYFHLADRLLHLDEGKLVPVKTEQAEDDKVTR
jgi:putative ATP-binding cassette transporter